MNIDHDPILDEYRNDWYNKDYLELIARRIELKKCKDILDVGCGKFHWSYSLLEYFSKDFKLTGIDINSVEDKILKRIKESNKVRNCEISFVKGNSEDLPFGDSSFDLVTCQTLLIHLKEPLKTLKEMYRVLRKNGRILICEPNNLSQMIFTNTMNLEDEIDFRIENIKAKMISETEKIESGNGNNSIGETVPILLDECGFTDIKCWINDKVNELKPPYETSAEQNKIKMLEKLAENYPFNFSVKEKEEIKRMNQMIKNKKFMGYNPTMLFLTVGKKK